MKFNHGNKKVGDTRIKSWFAWFPVRLHGETRWMERVTVEQVCYGYSMMGEQGEPVGWMNKRFVDESEAQ